MEPLGPAPRRSASPPNPFATPAAAGALAVILVALVAAIVLVPGMLPGASPSASSGPTCSASGSSSPICTVAPTRTPATSPTASPLPSFTRPTPTPAPTFTSYVVRAGDTLTSIARAFQTTPRSVAWWNRGAYPTLDPESEAYAPNHIEPGWVLQVIPGTVVDDLNPPTPSPGAPTPQPSGPGGTGTPAPSALPTATAATGSPAAVITNGPRGTAQVALTFDMGGRLDPAVAIVQWLIDHDVHATIFPTGLAGTTTVEGRAALQLAVTRPDLFALGNHSWDHPSFTTLTAAQMATELTATETAIHDLVGRTTRPYFRPPYGAWTYAVRVGVGAAGWSRIMMWDVDTIDWKPTSDGGPTADDIVAKVLGKAQGGSIVLMHLGGYHTLEALPNMLMGLQARGLEPVTLTEMLGA